MEEEKKKKKSLLSWHDVIKLSAAMIFGVTITVFLIEQCSSSNYQRYSRMETFENRIISSFEKKMVLSGIEVDSHRTFEGDTIGIFEKDGKFGYYHRKKKEIVIPAEYEEAQRFSEGLAGVMKEGRVGFINLKGETVIGFDYLYKEDKRDKSVFQYGYCAVLNAEGKFGVIDHTGKWVITPEYEDATVCKDYAVVKVKGDFDKQMDYSGRVLNKYLFDDVVLLWYGYQSDFTLDDKKATSYCKYTIDGRCGLMDVKGTILTEPIYTDIVAIEKELFLATLLDGNSKVVLNGKGDVINW